MHYTPRTIAFLCELLHPPQAPDSHRLQKIHNRLFERGAPPYSSFNVTPLGTLFSNPSPRPGTVSQVAFLADRLQFREELSFLTVEEFGERVRDVTELVADQCGIQLLTAISVTLRTLVNPRHWKDSREFLRQAMFDMGEEVGSLGREPRMWGLRLVFPPGPEDPNAFALRIESYTSDPRSLFIENQGTFGPVHVARGLEPVAQSVEATYRFITERALPFVERFDAHQQA
jgi:hypothetical protein